MAFLAWGVSIEFLTICINCCGATEGSEQGIF